MYNIQRFSSTNSTRVSRSINNTKWAKPADSTQGPKGRIRTNPTIKNKKLLNIYKFLELKAKFNSELNEKVDRIKKSNIIKLLSSIEVADKYENNFYSNRSYDSVKAASGFNYKSQNSLAGDSTNKKINSIKNKLILKKKIGTINKYLNNLNNKMESAARPALIDLPTNLINSSLDSSRLAGAPKELNKMSLDLKKSLLFNKNIANNQYGYYEFNKYSASRHPFEYAAELIKLSFLTMGCLISKPKFNVVYTTNIFENKAADDKPLKKIIISLFYLIRTKKYYNNLNKKTFINIFKDYIINNNKHNYIKDVIISNFKNFKNKTPAAIFNHSLMFRHSQIFNYLINFLIKLFNANIQFDIIRLKKPFFDSNILVQYLALKSYRNRFVKLTSKLFKRIKINTLPKFKATHFLYPEGAFPSTLSGIYVRLGGRLFKQKVIPKMTLKQTQLGGLTNVNVKFIEKATYTGKTRRGSFTFTVKLGHVFF